MGVYINPDHLRALAFCAKKEALEGLLAVCERKLETITVEAADAFEKPNGTDSLTYNVAPYCDWIESLEQSDRAGCELFAAFTKTLRLLLVPVLEVKPPEPVSNTVPPVVTADVPLSSDNDKQEAKTDE